MKSTGFIRQTGLGLIARAVSMIAGLLLVSLALRYYGPASYGIYCSIAALTGFLALTDAGIGAGLRNRLSAEVLNNSPTTLRTIVASAYLILLRYTMVGLGLAIFLAVIVPWKELLSIPNEYYAESQIVMLLSVVISLVSLWLGLVNSVGAALGKQSMIGVVTAVGFILACGFIVLFHTLLPEFDGVIAIALSSLLGPFLAVLGANILLFRHYNHLSPLGATTCSRSSREMLGFGGKVFVINITDQLIFASSSIIVSSLFGVVEVAGLVVAQRFFVIMQTMLGVVVFTANTKIVQSKAAGDFVWIARYVKYSSYGLILISVFTLCVPLVLPYFSDMLSGGSIELNSGLVWAQTVFAVVCYWNTFYRTVLIGLSDLKPIILCATLGLALNAVIVFPLALKLGSAGVVLASVVALLPSVLILPSKIYKIIS